MNDYDEGESVRDFNWRLTDAGRPGAEVLYGTGYGQEPEILTADELRESAAWFIRTADALEVMEAGLDRMTNYRESRHRTPKRRSWLDGLEFITDDRIPTNMLIGVYSPTGKHKGTYVSK